MELNNQMYWHQLLSWQRIGQEKKDFVPEDLRSEFDKDYDRIIFSHPFRRLQDKTQVIPLPVHDFVHTRLTHSLEVSSVGRTLGKLAGEIILKNNLELASHGITKHDFGAIVAAACLAHDLGNPPFGHSGEDAISEFFLKPSVSSSIKHRVSDLQWADLINFEGNAQGFRILNKAHYQGLKLTMATLAAFTKYPKASSISNKDSSRKSQKKYGFFQSEKEVFQQLADRTGLINFSSTPQDSVWCRHPLAFLVEAADDICYHIIDLEDGCRLNLVDFSTAKILLADIIGDDFQPQKLDRIKDKNEKIGLLRAMAINKLVQQCAKSFEENLTSIGNGSFDRAFTEIIPTSGALKEIINISVEKIYNSAPVLQTEAAGFEVIAGLLESFTEAVLDRHDHGTAVSSRNKSLLKLIPDQFYPTETTSVYDILMNMSDFVAGMTDSYAITLYRKIRGISL